MLGVVAVNLRPRLVVVLAAVVALIGVGLLEARDEDDRWGTAILALFVVMILVGAVRQRVEVRPDRVQVARTFRSEEVLRQDIVSVHASGGRGRPAFIEVADGRGIGIPSLMTSRQVAGALGVPHRTWKGHEVVPIRQRAELGTPWVGVVAVLLGATAIAIPIWYYATV